MKKGDKVLVIKKDSSNILEWECLDVSENAYKVVNLVRDKGFSFLGYSTGTDPFWILKTDIDNIGQAKFKIIDKLN